MPKLKKLKQLSMNLILGLGSVVFALGIGEIGLRILGISYPSFYQADEYRGHALIPGISGWWTHEGKGWVAINQDGLRDRDYFLEKPPNTFRIAVLGDSFAEAIQVNVDKTFWSVMEEQLPSCQKLNGQKVEVINFGVGDYGTAQELMTLKHQVKKYSPDLVILAIFTGNDITNNSQVLSPPDRFSPFLIQKDGKYLLDFSFKDTETYQWRNSWPRQIIFSVINNSRTLQLINEARVALKNRRAILGEQKHNNEADVVQYLDFTPELYKPSDKNWEEAWKITEELIKLVRDETQNQEANFLAVTLSNPAQVYPDPSLRDDFFEKAGVIDPFYPEQRIKKLGEKEEFNTLILAPLLQSYADRNKSFLHGFKNTIMGSGHWNELGHELAGNLMTDHVCHQLILSEKLKARK